MHKFFILDIDAKVEKQPLSVTPIKSYQNLDEERHLLCSSPFSCLVFTRLCQGSFKERCIWFLILLILFSSSIFLCLKLVDKYNYGETYFNRNVVLTNNNYFPSLTVCAKRKQKHLYCNLDLKNKYYRYRTDFNKPCNRNQQRFSRNEYTHKTGTYTLWGNGDFEVSCMSSKNCRSGDINHIYFKSSNGERGNCITWNYNGNYTNVNDEIELSFSIPYESYQYQHVEAIIHNHKLHGPTQKTSFVIGTKRSYEIGIKKKVVNRLPTSKMECVQKEDTKLNDIFPGAYSQVQCFDSLHCMAVYKSCNDTFDFCREFIPGLKRKTNGTLKEMRKCLQKFDQTLDKTKCPIPCHEEKYEFTISRYESKEQKQQFSILLKYQEPSVYTVETEKYIFTSIELLADVAGVLAFLIGGPIIFIFELPMFIIKKCLQKKYTVKKT